MRQVKKAGEGKMLLKISPSKVRLTDRPRDFKEMAPTVDGYINCCI